MPKRPIQHQLEDQSRTAFQSLIPSGWVVRELTRDYGLDAQVEIFENEIATGDSFFVQLKATGTEDLRRALRVRLTHEVAGYYASLALPVLVVLFHAPSKRIFTRWFHSFDPHFGGHNVKSITLKLSEDEEWTKETPTQLAAVVRGFRRWRSSRIGFPVILALEVERESLYGIPTPRVTMRIRGLAGHLPDVVRIAREPTLDMPKIHLEEGLVVVDFQGITSVSSHRDDYDGATAATRLPNDVMVTVAAAFGHIGQVNAAVRLLSAYGGQSSLLDDPEILIRAAGFYVEAHRPVDAIHLADELRSRDEQELHSAAEMLYTAVLAQAHSLSGLERDAVRRHLEMGVAAAEEEEDAYEARVSRYNAGDWEANERNWSAAFIHFCRAAEWDPGYLERGYFCSNLAGVLFELGHYENSAEFYSHARRLGEGGVVIAKHADALMHAGLYTEAKEAFEEYFSDPPEDGSPVWLLKAWGLVMAENLIGLEERERHSNEAARVGQSIDVDSTDDLVLDKIEEALLLDPLHGQSWFNLGVAAGKADASDLALLGFVMAGLDAPGDVEAWSNAILIALWNEPFHPLFDPIVRTAFHGSGETLIDQLADFLTEKQMPGFPVAEALAAVEDSVRHMHQDPGGFTLRFLEEGANYETFTIDRPDPEVT